MSHYIHVQCFTHLRRTKTWSPLGFCFEYGSESRPETVTKSSYAALYLCMSSYFTPNERGAVWTLEKFGGFCFLLYVLKISLHLLISSQLSGAHVWAE